MLILGGKVFQVIRKIYVTILSVVVAVFLLVGCGQADNARTRDCKEIWVCAGIHTGAEPGEADTHPATR